MSSSMISADNHVIQGLWIGPELSAMEQLSLASFLANGHEYHLYAYEPVRNVPLGVVMRDAEEILPRSSAFQYSQQASWSGFSNFFRYKLLLELGGWWVDTDFVCVRPFDFADAHVFASEFSLGRQMVTSGVIKAPAGSEAMAHAWEVCQKKDPTKLVWGETGPALVAEVVEKFSMQQHVRDWKTFCPIGFRDWRDVLDPRFPGEFEPDTYTIHFWNEMWRASGQDKNHHYHPGTLYERLRRSYLGAQDRVSLESLGSALRSLSQES